MELFFITKPLQPWIRILYAHSHREAAWHFIAAFIHWSGVPSERNVAVLQNCPVSFRRGDDV